MPGTVTGTGAGPGAGPGNGPAPLHVMIIGGGIGGLCLAQGLRKAGVDVSVYERDRTRTDRLQGYRMDISPVGSSALHRCLPPRLFDAFVATTATSSKGFTFLTERLEALLHVPATDIAGGSDDPTSAHHSVSRMTLRQVLLAGLEGVVRFDKRFTRYEDRPDGKVVAHFEDGTTAVGDVLVGADGGRSRVRGQYLPNAVREYTGIVAIAGKLPLTEETRPLLPAPLWSGPALVGGVRGGHAMFLACQEFDRERIAATAAATVDGRTIGGADEAADAHPGALFDNTADYLMWSFSTLESRYRTDTAVTELDTAALQRLVLDMTEDWHPDLRRLVAASDPSTITPLPLHTSAPVAPWTPSRVTLLGDAIHSMTPFPGVGANTALRDADELCRRLVAAHRGEQPLLAAIGAYESAMRDYAWRAVKTSLATARRTTSDSAVGWAVGRAFLRVANAVPPLRRRLFATPEGAGRHQTAAELVRVPQCRVRADARERR
ncbi:FAD-dependent oxidoreductase, partial [Streptomyces sp. URMC 123]|uniref:FAD-dependent oxidoreductase n=1 Tax=Streptomyces sp. URMC 123 TaxID=3423403 RepID=UPI003F1DA79D